MLLNADSAQGWPARSGSVAMAFESSKLFDQSRSAALSLCLVEFLFLCGVVVNYYENEF